MTGIVLLAASSSTVSWANTRAAMMSTQRDKAARHVFSRLAGSQAHVAGRKVDGRALQVRHARLETDARSQGRLFKDQSQSARVLPVQAAFAGQVIAFQPRRHVQQGSDLLRGHIKQTEQRPFYASLSGPPRSAP